MGSLPRPLSHKALSMQPSGIREISERVFALQAQGAGG